MNFVTGAERALPALDVVNAAIDVVARVNGASPPPSSTKVAPLGAIAFPAASLPGMRALVGATASILRTSWPALSTTLPPPNAPTPSKKLLKSIHHDVEPMSVGPLLRVTSPKRPVAGSTNPRR